MSEIRQFIGNNFFLSNMYLCNVDCFGQSFPSVEHGYLWSKTLVPKEQQLILSCPNPKFAKKQYSRQVTLRPDWNEVKDSIMTELVYCKFTQNAILADKLLQTMGHSLIEGNNHRDNYWGTCPPTSNTGKNKLGKILEAVRYHLWLERENQ